MVNIVVLVGNLGKDPEVRHTTNGNAVANFSIATSEKWGDGSNLQERTTWHNIVVWGKQAESCGKYLSKGKKVFIQGRIQVREYEHEGKTRYITEIVARDVKFLTPRNEAEPHQESIPEPWAKPVDINDDIPF